MQIGINGEPRPEDEWYWRDLGVAWVKWSGDVTGVDPPADDRKRLDYARHLGLQVCVDLRTSSEWMTVVGMAAHERLAQAGKLQSLPEGGAFEEQDKIIRANQAATQAEVLELIAEGVRNYVARHGEYCRDWEWWGEWDCPVTSAGIFHIICYPQTLQVVNRAIKEVQPEARVWTGGNGMDLHDGWVVGLRQDGAFKDFDVLNWHPYPMVMRNRAKIETKLHDNYSGWRKLLDSEGLGQPYASTEWGYPSLRRVTPQQRGWLESHVVEGGISQLYPEEALEFYEGDLRIMEQHGFQVVMVHTIRDTASRHWGAKCGLLELPAKGVRGKARRLLGLEKKPVYKLVKRWAERGQEGPPAFLEWEARQEEARDKQAV